MIKRRWDKTSMTSVFPGLSRSINHDAFDNDWRMQIDFRPLYKDRKIWKTSILAPGLRFEDFDVKISDGKLIVSVAKKESLEEITDDFKHEEYDFHSFKRTIKLPENLDLESIDIKYKKSKLCISITEKEPVDHSNMKLIPVEK